MTTPATTASLASQNENSEGLMVGLPMLEVREDVLVDLHNYVQGKLAALDDLVRQRVPDVVIHSARTTGKQFLLFTHRTYSSPSHESIDPVVVGLTFKLAGGGVSIEADASGEETGDLIFLLPHKLCSHGRTELIESATDLADQLVAANERISTAVVDASRRA